MENNLDTVTFANNSLLLNENLKGSKNNRWPPPIMISTPQIQLDQESSTKDIAIFPTQTFNVFEESCPPIPEQTRIENANIKYWKEFELS